MFLIKYYRFYFIGILASLLGCIVSSGSVYNHPFYGKKKCEFVIRGEVNKIKDIYIVHKSNSDSFFSSERDWKTGLSDDDVYYKYPFEVNRNQEILLLLQCYNTDLMFVYLRENKREIKITYTYFVMKKGNDIILKEKANGEIYIEN